MNKIAIYAWCFFFAVLGLSAATSTMSGRANIHIKSFKNEWFEKPEAVSLRSTV